MSRTNIILNLVDLTERAKTWLKKFQVYCDGRFFHFETNLIQRELGALLTIKLGKTRLKWQLACEEEPSLLSRSGIRPLTGTAVDKTD